MKKLIFGITISMLVLLVSIWVISARKNVLEDERIYTIPRILTYHSKNSKQMKFELFINRKNSIIEYPDENTFFIVDNKNSYQLNEVIITKEKSYVSKEEVFYKYTITSNLLNFSKEDIIFPNCILRIINDSFTLECPIGYVGIYNKAYPKLNFTDLYGNYAYVQGELHLIGITIQLDERYQRLQSVLLGSAYVPLHSIEKDVLYDSERLEGSLKHSVLAEKEEEKDFPLTAKQNYYFWPISYTNLALFTTGCILVNIDGETYYIEDFTYLANDISIENYKHIQKEGKIQYA